MDAGRSPSGAAANATTQTYLGRGGPRRLMIKPTLDHIGIAVRSLETARIYSALGLSIDSVETVESQGVKTAFIRVGDANLELLEPISEDSPVGRFIERREPRSDHDVRAAVSRRARFSRRALRHDQVVWPALRGSRRHDDPSVPAPSVTLPDRHLPLSRHRQRR